jgi:signal transduction histidine kinase
MPPAEQVPPHLDVLLDSVAAGIVSLDGEGRIRVFNAAAENLFRVSRGAVLGVPFGDAGRRLPFDGHAARTLWERLSDAVWAAGAVRDLEYHFLPRGGSERVISYSVYPLGRTAWSVDNGVVIVLEDVTRKKDMEDQVSEARKRLQAVFDGITDGIQVIDGEFRITAVNKSMTALLNRNIRVGEHCYEACMVARKVCTDCPALETFQSGRPSFVTKKLTVVVPGGERSERVVEVTTFPLLDRGSRVVQVVEYLKDVTDRVRLAESLEQARRLAELGEMAARVAHEVRNPLNAIAGAAHFLATEYEDETIRKFTDLITRQATRVNQVASDLLSVSKPMRPRPTDVNVNALLDQSLESLCEQLLRQRVTVRTSLARDLPLIRADEVQIEQAIQNIIRNAIEAMPDGGVLAASTAVSDHGGMVDVVIEDTGHGIAESDRDRIFQSFYTTKTRGTGLGLTIVQRVLKDHGGEIALTKAPGGGTRAVLRLPVKTAEGATRPA